MPYPQPYSAGPTQHTCDSSLGPRPSLLPCNIHNWPSTLQRKAEGEPGTSYTWFDVWLHQGGHCFTLALRRCTLRQLDHFWTQWKQRSSFMMPQSYFRQPGIARKLKMEALHHQRWYWACLLITLQFPQAFLAVWSSFAICGVLLLYQVTNLYVRPSGHDSAFYIAVT